MNETREMRWMKFLFSDGNWQTVSADCELTSNGEINVVFDLAIDDSIVFSLTPDQLEELGRELIEHAQDVRANSKVKVGKLK